MMSKEQERRIGELEDTLRQIASDWKNCRG